jgi:hypothetical protein
MIGKCVFIRQFLDYLMESYTAFCEFLEKGHGPWAKGTWARPFSGKKGTGTGT